MTDHQQVYRSEAETYQQLISREDFQDNLPAAIKNVVVLESRDLLDLGAGTGRISCEFVDQVRSLTALDLSPGMLGVARQRLVRSGQSSWLAAAADHRQLPLPQKSVDLVISAWSFSYLKVWSEGNWVPEIEQGLREVRRVLRGGGDFLVIETLGTGYTAPVRLDFLEEYFGFLESAGFNHTWVRTDYRFASRDEAESLAGFFFGDEIIEKLSNGAQPVLPECTGLWWKNNP